ncbi:MAG: alpha/beta fold hydrolase [Planctomycetota bacterium]
MTKVKVFDHKVSLSALAIVCVSVFGIGIGIDSAKPKIDAPRQSLVQFVFDTTVNENANEAINVLHQYKDSDRFYLDQNEYFRTCHLLYQQGKIADFQTLNRVAEEHFPKLKKSFAKKLFELTHYEDVEKARQWIKDDYGEFLYRKEHELNMAVLSFYRSKQYDKARVIAEAMLQALPDSKDAHERMAEIHLIEGNCDLALQTYRKGIMKQRQNSFFKLAVQPPTKYKPTKLPADPNQLYQASGNLDSDLAFVFVQGGPTPNLGVYRTDPLSLLPFQDDIMRVNVLESQILNPGLLAVSPPLTEQQALFEHAQSAEILRRTVDHLKSKGKKVFVIGHSYGCMISLEYLLSDEIQADRVVLMGSDPDEDLRNYPDELKGAGMIVRWKDGVEPFERPFFGSFPMAQLLTENLNRIFENTDMLVASHAKRRFTELLDNKDLSNVIFAHARFDESNGRTKQYELEFLKNHGATVVESFGDHHSMLNRAFMVNLYGHLVHGKQLKLSVASILSKKIDTDGIEKAVDWFHIAKLSPGFHDVNETEINLLGYQLLNRNMTEEAIEVFKLNVESFPNSWNVFDSLGECYMNLGKDKLARKYYERSLDIHPGNAFGIAAIKAMNKS